MYVYEHKSAKYVDQKTSNQNPCVTLTSVCTHAICKNPKLQDLKKKISRPHDVQGHSTTAEQRKGNNP